MKRNYNNSIIYIIKSDNESYINSTTQSIEQRLQSLRHYNFFSYREPESLKRILSSDDMQIDILEHYKCNSKRELELRVRYWRYLYDLELNNLTETKRCRYVRSYKKDKIQPVVIDRTCVTINWDR
jgi:hypothetical protein